MVKKRDNKKNSIAVVRIGGKQFLVRKNDEILVDRLNGENGRLLKKGTNLRLETLLIDKEGALKIGKPKIKTGQVKGEIISDIIKDNKVIVFKYKPKKRYRRKKGFRSHQTKVRITGV